MSWKKQKLSKSDRIFDIVNNVFLILCLIVVAFPLMNVVSQSISAPKNVIAGKVLFWPVDISFEGFKEIVTNRNVLNGFLNSFVYTTAGTVISIIITLMAAYPLSRKNFAGKQVFVWIFTFTMLFNGGLIPTYLMVRSMHMYDTIWAVIIPNALSVWNMIIARTFFQSTIPAELYEASELDGCNDTRLFVSVVLPLSKPIIAVLVLFYAIGIWNSYFDAMIYLSTASKFPLQLVLRNILIKSQMLTFLKASSGRDQSGLYALVEVMKYAVIVFASVPVMLLYPFIQKYFVKGIMIGSIKG